MTALCVVVLSCMRLVENLPKRHYSTITTITTNTSRASKSKAVIVDVVSSGGSSGACLSDAQKKMLTV